MVVAGGVAGTEQLVGYGREVDLQFAGSVDS
jgi:hypothetical protein